MFGNIWLKVSISALARMWLWAESQEQNWCFFTSGFSQISLWSRKKFCIMVSQLSMKCIRELLALLQSLQKPPKTEKDKTKDTCSSLDLYYSVVVHFLSHSYATWWRTLPLLKVCKPLLTESNASVDILGNKHFLWQVLFYILFFFLNSDFSWLSL